MVFIDIGPSGNGVDMESKSDGVFIDHRNWVLIDDRMGCLWRDNWIEAFRDDWNGLFTDSRHEDFM